MRTFAANAAHLELQALADNPASLLPALGPSRNCGSCMMRRPVQSVLLQ
jgi:hypothetical protein